MSKKTEQTENINGKYGFISMAAMIIGIVVASGIFVKNSEIITGTNSAILTTIAWVVGGLIVICMMMGFLEITSSSRLKKQQGTILNWSRNFLGKNASMIIGFYITFLYIPLLTIGLSFFSASYLMDALNIDFSLAWGFIFITVIGILFMAFAQVINALTSKPGKIFQTAGTFIKLIPLFAIIVIAIAAIAGAITTVDPNAVFDPDSSINTGINDDVSVGGYIALIFAVLPGILFSFDGFLYADSLSLEAKKTNTYKKALIFSIIFIILIYIVFSLSTMVLATPNAKGDFGDGAFDTTTIFGEVFPNHLAIGTILVLLIMISVLVAVNGLATVSSRNLADASSQNLIKDKNGVLLRRNGSEAPYNSAFKIFIFMIIFALILRSGDAIMVNWKSSTDYASGKDLQLTGIATSLAAVFMFFMYGVILMGGVANRFTKKVEVQKSFGFIFFAIIAMLFMIASSGYFLWDIFLQDIVLIANNSVVEADLRSTAKELIAMVFFLTILISMWIGIVVYNYNHTKEVDFNDYPAKITTRKTYDALINYKDYEKAVFTNSNFSTLVDNADELDYEWYLKQQATVEAQIVHQKEVLHIRSFLPLKLQEKHKEFKENISKRATSKKAESKSKTKKEEVKKETTLKTKEVKKNLIEEPNKNKEIKKNLVQDPIKNKETKVFPNLKLKQEEQKLKESVEAKIKKAQETKAQKIADKNARKKTKLAQKKATHKAHEKMSAQKLEAKQTAHDEQLALNKAAIALEARENARIEKEKIKVEAKKAAENELIIQEKAAAKEIEVKKEKKAQHAQDVLDQKEQIKKDQLQQEKKLEALEKVIIAKEMHLLKQEAVETDRLIAKKKSKKIAKKKEKLRLIQKTEEAEAKRLEDLRLLNEKEKNIEKREIAKANAKNYAMLGKARADLDKAKLKAKKLEAALAKKKEKLERNEPSKTEVVVAKIKDLETKTKVVAKEDFSKLETKTKELAASASEKLEVVETTIKKSTTTKTPAKAKKPTSDLATLQTKQKNVKGKQVIEALKVMQSGKDFISATKDVKAAKVRTTTKTKKSQKEELAVKDVQKLNKQVLKESKLAEKEALTALKEKQKADVKLEKLQTLKTFNDLKNYLFQEGVNFNFKISRKDLQEIVEEFSAYSLEQLDAKFDEYDITIKDLETKGQKYNLLKEFEKTTVERLKAQLVLYKISYPKEATKGQLFSLVKNH